MAIKIEYKDVENKLLILHFINMMEFPISRNQLTDFIIAKDLMNHFTLEQSLNDMIDQGFLDVAHETAQDMSTTRYTITEEGFEHLGLLSDLIPGSMLKIIDEYVAQNKELIVKEYEKTAHYFSSIEDDEFIVKCGVYDYKRSTMLMEITLPVVTREQAKRVQSNWNQNYSSIYKKILTAMTEG